MVVSYSCTSLTTFFTAYFFVDYWLSNEWPEAWEWSLAMSWWIVCLLWSWKLDQNLIGTYYRLGYDQKILSLVVNGDVLEFFLCPIWVLCSYKLYSPIVTYLLTRGYSDRMYFDVIVCSAKLVYYRTNKTIWTPPGEQIKSWYRYLYLLIMHLCMFCGLLHDWKWKIQHEYDT